MNSENRPMIGIVVPTVDNSFFSNLADSAARSLHTLGCTALILSSQNSAEIEKEHLKMLAECGAKGILCVSVKLISFDNSPYSTMASPAITALDRNPRMLAETAVRCLLDRIAGNPVPPETIIPVSLCKRDSTR